ncbi:hypothetical protein KLP28_07970 [Nocardioidaceae bacterium]|nr:hypothetical protein KLP28_07970 [Nocardioidaceae bacterium]
MGLRRRLVSAATVRPRVYVVESPGGAAVRMAVEDELDRRHWLAAESPASADVLLLAGATPAALVDAEQLLWSQLPGPRTRTTITDAREAAPALDRARRALRDAEAVRRDARQRPTDLVEPWVSLGHDDHADTSHEHEDHHDGGGGDHDHEGMDMAPGGVPLAGGAEDRDGLEMDVLEHPLGPLLDRWPGGLQLTTRLHGDTVAEVEVRWWARTGVSSLADDRGGATDALDAVATVLSLVGDERWAHRARRNRAEGSGGPAGRDAPGLRRRLRRLKRLGVLPGEAVSTLLRQLDGDADPLDDDDLVAVLAGRDLGDVRLLVASYAPLLHCRPHGSPSDLTEQGSDA